jgi:hypothetical protein
VKAFSKALYALAIVNHTTKVIMNLNIHRSQGSRKGASVVHVNGLALTLRVNVNPIMKFICTPCKCKNKYIYMILCDPIKKCKCKNIYIYMILHGYIKQCKYITM